MEKYPLQSLLDVRKYRENNAQHAVGQAENGLKEIIRTIEKQKQKILDYKTWKAEEEEKAYAKIIGKKVRSEDLEHFKNCFAKLKSMEYSLEEELLQLEQKKQEQLAVIEQKKEEYKLAKKNTAKIEAHNSVWTEQKNKEQERKEDLETEEFKPLPPLGSEQTE